MTTPNNTPTEMIKDLDLKRCRPAIKQEIIDKALADVDKLKDIPYPQNLNPNMFFWRKNDEKDNNLSINLPCIEIDELHNIPESEFRNKSVYYDMEKIEKDNIKMMNNSCVVVHKKEIMCVYVNEKTDKAITEATKHLKKLGEQMGKYYPCKEKGFYSGFRLGAKTDEEKKAAHEFKKEARSSDAYKGYNYLDGMIKYFKSYSAHYPNRTTGTAVVYQPRDWKANEDEDFLYNLVYSYCALQELENRYCPAIAAARQRIAEKANYVGSLPNVPLSRCSATGLGASKDFASSLHNDSGIEGLTETIFWNKCDEGKKQLFVCPTLKLCFNLHDNNAIIFQPPKIPHGTADTGNHGGYGFVNITKQGVITTTQLNKDWFATWREFFKKDIKKEEEARRVIEVMEKISHNKSNSAKFPIDGKDKYVYQTEEGIYYKDKNDKVFIHKFQTEPLPPPPSVIVEEEVEEEPVEEPSQLEERLKEVEEFMFNFKAIVNILKKM
jgi:hypothetical protein